MTQWFYFPSPDWELIEGINDVYRLPSDWSLIEPINDVYQLPPPDLGVIRTD